MRSKQAIQAVCDLFRGQEICQTEFTVTRAPAEPQARLAFADDVAKTNLSAILEQYGIHNLRSL